MEVIKKRGVVNCCVVVTRYFGGVLLGAGGLVRAYSQGCAIALDAAQVSTMERSQRYLFDIPYPMWDKFSYHLQSYPVLLENTDFQASVEATLLVRKKDAASVLSALTTLMDGHNDFLLADELFYPWPDEC